MRENSFLKENILQFLEYKGVTKYEFYQKTGISNGVLSQKNGLSEDNILKFLSYYTEINPEWFLTRKGEMIRNTNAELSVNEPKAYYSNEKDNEIIEMKNEIISLLKEENKRLKEENFRLSGEDKSRTA